MKNQFDDTSKTLTERWENGELPDGYYYCQLKYSKNVTIERCKAHCIPMGISSKHGEKVLSAVPSYDELQLMNEAVNQALAANAKLQERVSKLEKMQYSYTPEEWNTMLRTVNRTKELLKRCQTLLYDNGFLFNPQDREKAKDVIADICEVLDD